ncbi:MAG: acyl-ACP--UDP-N-acetylglucosamine O-acyltransferase [Phycisphaerales bacterium]|nr:acyl-ACP--UDP-N-acetylglucosamine O-acyltransferase [Phycisphaerales bacterium]
MIHPTAVISPEAKLAADVEVGACVVIDGSVTIGPGCKIQPYAHILGHTTLGARNVVHSTAVIGDFPQDRKYRGEHSEVVIGDDNIFREGVTVHRGTGLNTRTVIGNRCYLMVHSHVGHNCVISDDVTLVNGAVLGGFVQVAPRAIVGAYTAMHQFCRIGRLAMTSNSASHNVDIPPFFIAMTVNTVTQLNAVGLRRSGMPAESINGLRKMFQFAFRDNAQRPLKIALAALPADVLAIPEVQEVIAFCNASRRGVATYHPWSKRHSASD